MFKYFNGVEDKYYVDISSSFDMETYPIFTLKKSGWKGINLYNNYDKMSKYIPGRNPDQCRGHHEKKIKRFGSV